MSAVDFTICIAHRGNAMGLWATICACEADLADQRIPLNYNYVIVVNGQTKLTTSETVLTQFLGKSKRLKKLIMKVDPLSPPGARQLAAQHADGEVLFFFDNHCIPGRHYFARAMMDFDYYGSNMDMLHSATIFHPGEPTHMHYSLTLEKNFWAESSFLPASDYECYRIAAGGHGGFAVRRSVWNEVGGYWPGFVGYGGEEIYFDLKMALLGKKNWIDPKVIHYHFAGDRGYLRHYTDDYFRNMMMCANIIGGHDWMMRVYANFANSTRLSSDPRPMFDLLLEADERSRDYAAEFATKRLCTLDELLLSFPREGVTFQT